jgi:hypothetical protein
MSRKIAWPIHLLTRHTRDSNRSNKYVCHDHNLELTFYSMVLPVPISVLIGSLCPYGFNHTHNSHDLQITIPINVWYAILSNIRYSHVLYLTYCNWLVSQVQHLFSGSDTSSFTMLWLSLLIHWFVSQIDQELEKTSGTTRKTMLRKTVQANAWAVGGSVEKTLGSCLNGTSQLDPTGSKARFVLWSFLCQHTPDLTQLFLCLNHSPESIRME